MKRIKTLSFQMSLLLILLFSPTIGKAADITLGTTTWDADQVITGNITVPVGETLTISPGVKVEVDGDYQIIIEGEINAQGTYSQPIVFMPTSGKSWKGIKIDLASINTTPYKLKYITIQGATEGGLQLLNVNCEIRNSTITGNSRVNKGGGIYVGNGSTANIVSCLILSNDATDNNEGDGIYAEADCTIKVVNCTFNGNGNEALHTKSKAGSFFNCIFDREVYQGPGTETIFSNHISKNCRFSSSLISATWYNDSRINLNAVYNYTPEFKDVDNFTPKFTLDSELIDKGVDDPLLGDEDLYGNPRVENNTIDVGAVEYQHPSHHNLVFSCDVSKGQITGTLTQLVERGNSSTQVEASTTNNDLRFYYWKRSDGDFYSDENPLIIDQVFEDLNLEAIFLNASQPTRMAIKDAVIAKRDNEPSSYNNVAFGEENFLTLTYASYTYPVYYRSMIDFGIINDVDNIESATMYLYSTYSSTATNQVNSGDNGFRILNYHQSWDEKTITWTNHPITTSGSAFVDVPASEEGEVNYAIDVLPLIKSSSTNAASFHMLLLKEFGSTKVVRIASKEHEDATKHPKLVVVYKDVPNSIGNTTSNNYRVYPNPATDIINLKGFEIGSKVNVYSISGELVLSVKNTNNVIDVAGLTRGVYFIKTDISTMKIIIE